MIILTEKWLPAVPFLQFYCIVNLFKPIVITNLQSINAIGRSEIFLRLEIIKSVIYTIILIISLQYGPLGIAIGSLISSILSIAIYIQPNKKLLDLGFIEQIQVLIKPIFISIVISLIVYSINYLNINPLLELFYQTILGILTYIILSILLKIDSFYYLIDLVKGIFKEKRN